MKKAHFYHQLQHFWPLKQDLCSRQNCTLNSLRTYVRVLHHNFWMCALRETFQQMMQQEKRCLRLFSFFGSLIWLLGVIWSSWKHSANTNSIVFQCLNVKIGWKHYCAKALTTVILESALSGITKAVLLNKGVFLFYLHALMLPRQNFY